MNKSFYKLFLLANIILQLLQYCWLCLAILHQSCVPSSFEGIEKTWQLAASDLQLLADRIVLLHLINHFSPCRRWTARVETTSTLSSCMHPGRSCAGTMYCKCCTMQLRHQCINAPWPLLCRFNIILKWSQVLYNAVQSCEVMADEVQIPKPWSLACFCFCFCQHANVNLSSNLHPPKQQLLHSPRFEFLAKYLNIEK